MKSELMDYPVAKKKPESKPEPKQESKRQGTLIRVSDEFAKMLRQVCVHTDKSAAELIDAEYLPQLKQLRKKVLAKSMTEDEEK